MAKHGVGVVIGYSSAIFIVLLSSIVTAQKLVAHDDAERPMFQAVSRSNLQGLVGEHRNKWMQFGSVFFYEILSQWSS